MDAKRAWGWWAVTVLAAVGIALLIAYKIVSSIDHHNNDYFTFWLGGYLKNVGQNPYSPSDWVNGHHQFGVTWIPNERFVYPLPLATLFRPLALLPLFQSYVLWVALTVLMVIFTVALLLPDGPLRERIPTIVLFLLCIAIFRPAMITLTNGQLSGFLLLVAAGASVCFRRGRWLLGGMIITLLALKPNLGGPALVLLGLWALYERRWQIIGGMALAGLLLLLIGWAQNMRWVQEFIAIGNTKLGQTFGFSPTVWGMAAYTCGFTLNCTLRIGILLGLTLGAGYLYLLWRKKLSDGGMAISISLLLSLLLTPYTWPYDQLLVLLPVVLLAARRPLSGNMKLLNILPLLGLSLLSLALLVLASRLRLEIWNALIPLAVLALVLRHLLTAPPADAAAL